jgi:hypothetical protein
VIVLHVDDQGLRSAIFIDLEDVRKDLAPLDLFVSIIIEERKKKLLETVAQF